MRFQIIGFTLGLLITILGVTQLVPALIDWGHGHANGVIFLESAILCIFFGGGLVLSFRSAQMNITARETFLLTTLSWFGLSAFGALPLYMSDLGISYTDAFFEAASGITTTGSTVLSGLDKMSHGVLVWRSALQWIGGIGIIAFAIVLLPFLRVGGMQLFQTESSDRSDKIMPRSSSIVLSLLLVYSGITLICAMLYGMLGMTLFDAVNHAMTTISTGGYSTHDASFGYYNSPALHATASVFMLLGGLPFVLYIKLIFQGKLSFMKDEQFTTLMALLFILISGMTLWVWNHTGYSLGESLNYVSFNIISVITTTGYATIDYTTWGAFAAMFFFFLTYIGACAGSTSGGLKMIRLVIVFKALSRQIKRLLYPNAVFSLTYQRRPMGHPLVMSVFGFLGLYVASNVVLTIALSFTGLDFTTSISAAATAIANVGPGIGNVIGPAGNFSSLSDAAKWLLSFGMILGRLEVLTIMVLFTRQYWNN